MGDSSGRRASTAAVITTPKRVVVTGAGGFLGSRMVDLLRARGDAVVAVAREWRRGAVPEGVTPIQADVRNRDAMAAAMAGADVVFHAAAKVGLWGSRAEFFSVNVEGTQSALHAARQAGVRQFVYTSTPSVVGYGHDVSNGGHDLPYATVHESHYAATKCVAEQIVRDANGTGITTMVLRPHLIFGPGDRHLLPRVLQRAVRGQLRRVGDGDNLVDLTFIDNAAWAHLDGADALSRPQPPCAGKAYFISNAEPVVLWKWVNGLLESLGLPHVTRTISLDRALLAARVAEAAWRLTWLRGDPPITRFLALALARSHWYDMRPAELDLGYRVRVPMRDATLRTAQWLAEQSNAN